MKKLLSILLATATVFSTTAFANPAAEPIESADEISIEVGGEAISSKISDASLTEETASYYDPTLGVRLIGENFEGWKDTDKLFPTKNASGKDIQNAITYNGLVYTLEGGTTKADIVSDEQNGKALKVIIDGTTRWPSLRVNFANKVTVPAKFTMSAQYKYADVNFAAKAALIPEMRLGNNNLTSFKDRNITDKNCADVWLSYDKIPTFTLDNLEKNKDARALQLVFEMPQTGLEGTILVDNIYLYYKPTNQVEYKVEKVVYPTVTVSAPEGIEKNAATALTAEPQKYFGKFVNSCAVDGNTITLTVNGAGNVSLPSVVNADKTKTYKSVDVPVTKVDALAPLYGINLIDENFESFPVGETYGIKDYKPHGNRTYATEGGNTSGVLVENDGVGSGKYIKLNIDDKTKYPSFKTLLHNGEDKSYVSVPAEFTASIKMYFVGENFANAIGTRPALRYIDNDNKNNLFDKIRNTNFEAGVWKTLTKTCSQEDSGKTVRELMWIFEDAKQIPGIIYIDDIKLYYKPLAPNSYSDISFDFPTITVTAENGFEANAVAAMKANPAEYLTKAVKSVDFSGNKMIITLNEDEAVNYSSITIPALVNADRSATYGEKTVNIAVAPTSLAGETTIRAKSPAGLRFKAAVKSEFMENKSLTEFGYIVARAEILGDAELTANTSVNKIISPSFKRVNEEVTINKYERGVDNTTFAAVLVNIPHNHYGDEFAVRPYVVYGGEYYYGDTMKESILKVAQSLRDGGVTDDDVLEVVDKIINGQELPKYEG